MKILQLELFENLDLFNDCQSNTEDGCQSNIETENLRNKSRYRDTDCALCKEEGEKIPNEATCQLSNGLWVCENHYSSKDDPEERVIQSETNSVITFPKLQQQFVNQDKKT